MSLALLTTLFLLCLSSSLDAQRDTSLGRFQEVFAWKQLTYDLDGMQLTSDRVADIVVEEDTAVRRRRQGFVFQENDNFDRRPNGNRRTTTRRPTTTQGTESENNFFIQYNNIPMGVERVGDRLFITVPRRRYGIPSTLNYLDLTADANKRSPSLRPYPNRRESSQLTSVYRTRADSCGRLWMVDTGLLEIPGNPQQVTRPAIVIFDLNTNQIIRRYQLRAEDVPAANTPTGLASITIELPQNDCANAYAYIPDLTTYGIIVYSLRDNRSWRVTHNFFHFQPTASTLNIAGQRFQWNDGIFSIVLSSPMNNGCRTAWFHPMVSTQEFSVNTCILRNSSASEDSNYWGHYFHVGDRGQGTQSTMHDIHLGSNAVFFAEIGRDAVSCWNVNNPLSSRSIAILAQNNRKLSYPSDLHVTGEEVWVMANSLPRWAYSRLNTDDYNFFIYRGNVQELIANTVCGAAGISFRSGDASEEN